MSELTQDLLKSLLTYDPDTGVFTWVRPTSTRLRVGQVAGRMNGGYISIRICGREYGAHRLAWLYIHGIWPDKDIDHINRDRSDNRIENLRAATRAENLQNRDYTGVYWYARRSKWRVNIRANGKRMWIGDYADRNDALAARKAAVIKYHTHRPI